MIAHLPPRIAAFLAVALALGIAWPAGTPEPSRIRIATIDGTRGPVYYSVADGRFHPIVSLADRLPAEAERIAANGQ